MTDEQRMMEQIKDALVEADLDVYGWPFPHDAQEVGSKHRFYIEVGPHGSVRRFSVQVEEFARFQVGSTYF
jgi:hypothetical protein